MRISFQKRRAAGFSAMQMLCAGILVCVSTGVAQKSDIPLPATHDPALLGMQQLAAAFIQDVHIDGFNFTGREPEIRLETIPALSTYAVHGENIIREPRWEEMSVQDRALFTRLASYTDDEPTGKQLVEDQFYRLVFVHELGHWLTIQVLRQRKDVDAKLKSNWQTHIWEEEFEANRICVAWWRKHDSKYLARMMHDFRLIQAKSESPVPPGRNKIEYFNSDYLKGTIDSSSYGWFQMDMTLMAYDEQPQSSFSQVTQMLPTEKYEAAAFSTPVGKPQPK